MHDHDDLRIPALEALGNQFDLVAAREAAARAERRPRPGWALGGLVVPAVAVVAALIVLSVRFTPPADAAVAGAAARTAAAVTARFALRVQVEGAAGTPPVDVSTEGTYDRSTGRLRTSVDLASALGAGAPDAPVEAVRDGSKVYLRGDVFTAGLPAHRPWVVLDTARLDLPPGLGALGELDDLDATAADPASFLEALRGIGDDTRLVGEEVVEGAVTQHYRGTIHLDRALATLDTAEQARLRADFAGLGTAADGLELPTDVWVDAAGEVRRLASTVELAPAPGSGAGPSSARVTIDYLDVGFPPPIDVPAEADTSDITDLVGAALRGPLAGAGSTRPPGG